MDFTVVKSFYSEEMKSEYVEGMSYTARAPDDIPPGLDKAKVKLLREKRSLLLGLVPKWIKEGRVVLGRPHAQVRGEG